MYIDSMFDHYHRLRPSTDPTCARYLAGANPMVAYFSFCTHTSLRGVDEVGVCPEKFQKNLNFNMPDI